jgi:hypothetical protein
MDFIISLHGVQRFGQEGDSDQILEDFIHHCLEGGRAVGEAEVRKCCTLSSHVYIFTLDFPWLDLSGVFSLSQ